MMMPDSMFWLSYIFKIFSGAYDTLPVEQHDHGKDIRLVRLFYETIIKETNLSADCKVNPAK